MNIVLRMTGGLETSFFRQSRFLQNMWPCAFHFAKQHPCNVSWKHATVWCLDVLSPWFSHCSCWCFRNLADICWLENSSAFSLKLSTHLHFSNQINTTTNTQKPQPLELPHPFFLLFWKKSLLKALLWSMSPVHQAWVPYPTSVGHGHVNVHHPPRLSLWWWESWPQVMMLRKRWCSARWLKLVAENSINVDPIETHQFRRIQLWVHPKKTNMEPQKHDAL